VVATDVDAIASLLLDTRARLSPARGFLQKLGKRLSAAPVLAPESC